MEEPFLQTVFDHILSRDVVKKLMQVTQVMAKWTFSENILLVRRETLYETVTNYRFLTFVKDVRFFDFF